MIKSMKIDNSKRRSRVIEGKITLENIPLKEWEVETPEEISTIAQISYFLTA